jgi:hypothetical protein
MNYKYATIGKKQPGEGGYGRYVDPNRWKSGPDPFNRELYYAFLKHRSQANYRGEAHTLDFAEWQEFWTEDRWHSRGRGQDDLVLTRTDPEQGWSKLNCELITRRQHFARKKAQNAKRRGI